MNISEFIPAIIVTIALGIAFYLWVKDNYQTKKRLDVLESNSAHEKTN